MIMQYGKMAFRETVQPVLQRGKMTLKDDDDSAKYFYLLG